MCGIVGIVNYNEDISKETSIIKKMNDSLIKRGPDEDGFFLDKHVNLGHKRLIVIDPKGGKQPMSYSFEGITYTIVYNGQIYNTDELRNILISEGFTLNSHSDTEVLLKAFIRYGYEVCNHLNGIFAFAIWNDKTEELYMARDHFGIKPLYYTIQNKELIFSSEIKAILAHPNISPVIDKIGIHELFGIGPAHSPGYTPFKNIHEIKPANFIIYSKDNYVTKQYWKLESKPHTDDFNTTCNKIKYLLEDSIKKQLVSDVPLCTLLSGGLDSSIITGYASNYYNSKGGEPLNTFSIDYVDNDKNFVKSDFQPNTDKYYIDLMVNKFKTNHHSIVIDTPELLSALDDACIARDFPGMADVDSSLLLFCKYIKPHATVALSGECADEIFGGYPWFFREDCLESGTFPWSLAITERQNLLNPSISNKIDLKEYIDFKYKESLSNVEILTDDSPATALRRKIFYLNLNWFMQTLLDRSDRMSMYNGFEIRVPFCDYRIVEYLWNIPWEMKAYNSREKGLLRHIMEGFLPEEVIYRKKSPYPKTHNPNYLQSIKTKLNDIMKKSNAPIKQLLNEDYINDIINTDGASFTRPWFGQLMTGPQLMAYLYQVNFWLEKYKPQMELS